MDGEGQGCSGEAGNSRAAMDHAFCCPLIGLGDRPADLRPRPSDRYRRASLQLRRGRERVGRVRRNCDKGGRVTDTMAAALVQWNCGTN